MRCRKICFVLLTLLAFTQAGCLFMATTAVVGGGAAGLTGVAYVKGKLSQEFTAPMDKAQAATRAALYDLGFPQGTLRAGSTHAEIDSNTSLNEIIMIDIDAQKQTVPADEAKVRISIRVGTFGDATLSNRIFDQIEKRLNSNEPLPPALGTPNIVNTSIDQPRRQTDEPPLAR
ncbi:MAG TPA: DUF3568 family protein [Gemmataceae bacterium]|jgi:hypothetical protein|nr:DUF3568 family protein [Gemmataceae bacterium]